MKRKHFKEKLIEDQILFFLKKFPGIVFCWKNQSTGIFDTKKQIFRRLNKYQLTGVSDILGILNDGRFLAIEVKRQGNKPTENQINFMAGINAMGGLAFVAYSLDDVFSHLKQYLQLPG